MTTPGRLVLMREAAERLARPHAAEDILEHCRADLEERMPDFRRDDEEEAVGAGKEDA